MSTTTTRIRFADLGALHESIRDELDDAYARVLASREFNGGSEVEAFESAFSAMHGVRAGAACGSGTDALALSLGIGVSRGDERSIVPAMTFVATAEAVPHAARCPCLADVDPVTLLLTEATVADVWTRQIRPSSWSTSTVTRSRST